ncbi:MULTISPECIES: hypothetical protein [Pseudomonadati]|uniref:Uncharacterized protein n=1 Tax=Shewanella aestuarii TaxID=1028752 RepID=A0ABT0KYE9_9GAMM|nr:hypothetical protein [Shewanella aestuarii]MCL1116197.1 hypothetical protein [Shewanella aestuarii]GGN70936.1 hypothetical protein GCM10009193_06360 [Shewanella aestuarii]
MINLNKDNSDWKKWIVEVNEHQYLLGETGSVWGDGKYSFPVNDEVKLSICDIENIAFSSFPNELQLDIRNEYDKLGVFILSVLLNNSTDKPYLGYTWEIDPEKWKGHLNPYLLRSEMYQILKNDTKYSIDISPSSISNDFGCATLYFEINSNVVGELWNNKEGFAAFLDESVKLAEEKVLIGGFADKVVAKFSFDKNTEQACSTYLMYFIEFLRDLGIDAESSFKKDNGDVIFSIIPKDKNTALLQISEALSFYMKLPRSNFNDIPENNYDPIAELKLEKLKSEIDRLKSSLRINEALLRYQDTLISDQIITTPKPLTNTHQKEPIDGLSYIYVDENKQDIDSFLGGGVKLGVMKKAGIEIDWKALINYFRS